ncbi:unnamed protein product [Protopolystoma xenopodis]|uniref:Uncharacterized protein n=1 Tax=Protopolystoma xenopodis TaxID=117903 RepID=A0A3S5FC56_9PLAT|nr:unnamed protein product [Protopolystoma xenopodis]
MYSSFVQNHSSILPSISSLHTNGYLDDFGYFPLSVHAGHHIDSVSSSSLLSTACDTNASDHNPFDISAPMVLSTITPHCLALAEMTRTLEQERMAMQNELDRRLEDSTRLHTVQLADVEAQRTLLENRLADVQICQQQLSDELNVVLNKLHSKVSHESDSYSIYHFILLFISF